MGMSRTALAPPGAFSNLDHDRFHRAARCAALGGLMGGVAAYSVGVSLGAAAGQGALLTFSAVGASVAWASAAPRSRPVTTLAAGALTWLAGVAAFGPASEFPIFGVLLLGAALGGSPGWRLSLSSCVGSVVTGAAALALVSALSGPLVGSPWLTWMPRWAAFGALGGAMGFSLSFAGLPRLLGSCRDPVAEALEDLGGRPSTPLRQLALRAAVAHAATRAALWDAPAAVRSLSDDVAGASEGLALSVLAVAARWSDVEAALDLGGDDQPCRLVSRAEDLEAKAAAAVDPVVERGYLGARDQVRTLVAHHERLAEGRERLTARLHQQVATLESLRVACVHLRSADAQRFACEVSPLLDTAAELSAGAADLATVSDSLMAMA